MAFEQWQPKLNIRFLDPDFFTRSDSFVSLVTKDFKLSAPISMEIAPKTVVKRIPDKSSEVQWIHAVPICSFFVFNCFVGFYWFRGVNQQLTWVWIDFI